MSYSFNVRGANKAEAKTKVAAKLTEAAAAQSCHARDQQQAQAVADAFIDLLADDDSKDVVVSMNGSLMGKWTGTDVTIIEAAAVSVSAYLATKISLDQ